MFDGVVKRAFYPNSTVDQDDSYIYYILLRNGFAFTAVFSLLYAISFVTGHPIDLYFMTITVDPDDQVMSVAYAFSQKIAPLVLGLFLPYAWLLFRANIDMRTFDLLKRVPKFAAHMAGDRWKIIRLSLLAPCFGLLDTLWVFRELERIAFCDPRDVMQWDRVPEFDCEGNVLGWRDEVTATPSHFLTADQAAQVRSITTKKGSVTFEVHDKLAALDKLARVLGVYHEPPAPPPAVMVNQVNIGGDNALEAVRRLAFAIAKAQHTQSLLPQPAPSHVIAESSKE